VKTARREPARTFERLKFVIPRSPIASIVWGHLTVPHQPWLDVDQCADLEMGCILVCSDRGRFAPVSDTQRCRGGGWHGTVLGTKAKPLAAYRRRLCCLWL
jgi:hypothetical protein